MLSRRNLLKMIAATPMLDFIGMHPQEEEVLRTVDPELAQAIQEPVARVAKEANLDAILAAHVYVENIRWETQVTPVSALGWRATLRTIPSSAGAEIRIAAVDGQWGRWHEAFQRPMLMKMYPYQG